MVHQERGLAFTAQETDTVTDAEAAAAFTTTAGSLPQGIGFEEQRIVLFENLDGLGLGDANGGAAVGQAVTVKPAAVPAAGEKVHDVVALGFRIVAAEGQIAAGSGRRTEQAVGQGLGHRSEDSFHDALCDLRCTAGHGPRVLGIQESAMGRFDVQRREAAGVDRDLGEDVFHRHIDR